MAKPKKEAIELIKKLPNNCSFEDIQYHLYVREKVERGLRDLESKRVLSQDEVERRMNKWLGK
jgi:hypothetical protein